MSGVAILATCPACGNYFLMGPQVFDGKYIPRYKISVCMNCYDDNRAGWSPQHEINITKQLESNGIGLPEREPNGLLPRE